MAAQVSVWSPVTGTSPVTSRFPSFTFGNVSTTPVDRFLLVASAWIAPTSPSSTTRGLVMVTNRRWLPLAGGRLVPAEAHGALELHLAGAGVGVDDAVDDGEVVRPVDVDRRAVGDGDVAMGDRPGDVVAERQLDAPVAAAAGDVDGRGERARCGEQRHQGDGAGEQEGSQWSSHARSSRVVGWMDARLRAP